MLEHQDKGTRPRSYTQPRHSKSGGKTQLFEICTVIPPLPFPSPLDRHHPTESLFLFFFSFSVRSEGQLFSDLRDGQTRVQTLRARPRAVQDGVTPVQAHGVVEGGFARFLLLVS